VICLAQLMVVLDVSIVNIALPSIHHALKVTGPDLAWVIDAYSLSYGGLVLLGGRLSDLFGRRRVFLASVGLFVVASLCCGLASTAVELFVARFVQGMGAAAASPTALSLVAATVPPGTARNKAVALYGLMAAIGVVLGEVLGGALTGLLGWRFVFFVNVPIGLGLLVAGRAILHPDQWHQSGHLDLLGAVIGTAGLLGVAYGAVRAGADGWGDPGTIAALAAGGAMLASFVVVEVRSVQPMVPPRVLHDRGRATGYLFAFFFLGSVFPTLFYLTQFAQDIKGFGALKTGFAFLPCGLTLLLAAVVARGRQRAAAPVR
jgi:EmrB/QacA subfamily drug resistance transporter